MERGGGTKDLKVLYIETSMTASKRVPSDSRLDANLQGRIMHFGVQYACKMLNENPDETEFDLSASVPIDRATTKAGEYNGEFFISLSEKDKMKGFQEKLRQAQSQYSMVHTALVDFQQAESSKPKEVAKPGNADKFLTVSQFEKEIKGLKDKVKELHEENKVLKAENKVLKEEIKVLNDKVNELQDKVNELQDELQRVAAEFKRQTTEFNLHYRTAARIRLRIALDDANDKLTLGLGRSPPLEIAWHYFVQSVTPAEMERVGVTPSMLKLMASGKKSLNKAAHEATRAAIAAAVTGVQKNPDTWRAIFKYAYGEDADQIVFELESERDEY